jgi:hypothetical protein
MVGDWRGGGANAQVTFYHVSNYLYNLYCNEFVPGWWHQFLLSIFQF